MTQAIALILAISKTIPIIDKWLGELFAAYQVYKKKESQEATTRAINEGVENQDQRQIESDQTAGKPSGLGTIRDSIPNVGVKNERN